MGITERKEREKQQRRDDIVNAAEKVFFQKGMDNATMDEVAETAELSKGTLYLYFKSKAELHFAICVRGLEIMKEMFSRVIDKKRTAIENLMQIGLAYVEFSKKYSNYFEAIMHFEAKDEEKFDDCNFTHTEKDDVMQLLCDVLDKGKEEGSIRADMPSSVLTNILWAQTTGVLQMLSTKKFHLEAHSIPYENFFHHHIEILNNGIRPAAESRNSIRNTPND